MSDQRATLSWRSMPFNEHRTWREVVETERLAERRARGESLADGEYTRLNSLQSRATLPDSMRDPGPGAA